MAKIKTSIADRTWLKIEEVQEYVPLGMRTIRTLCNDGSIRCVKPKHGPMLTKKAWIDEYLESCVVSDLGNEIDDLFREVTNGR